MASHAPPSRKPAEREEADRVPAGTSDAQRPRCLGAAAQLAAIHRTLRGAPIQRHESGRPDRIARDAAAPPARVPGTPNRTGLPDRLKAGVEALSGLAMDDVRVRRNSAEPAKLGALAYAQGSEVHLGPGQDEHLPHEAWHVVQQKEGRVRPTARLGPVALNDDRALEAEADTMGPRALSVSAAHGRRPDRTQRAQRGGAIQRKLIRQGAEIPLPNTQVSPVVKQYIDVGETFVLRRDCQLTDDVIHILHVKSKYLLGEFHDGSVQWTARTKEWTKDASVNTMQEAAKTVPERRPQVSTDWWVFWALLKDEPRSGKGQALESAHAYTMAAALRVRIGLNLASQIAASLKRDEQAQKQKPAAEAFPDAERQLKVLEEQFDQLRIMYDPYWVFSKTYPMQHGTPGKGTREEAILAFHNKYEKAYLPLAKDLVAVVSKLRKTGVFDKKSEGLYAELEKQGTFIEPFVATLMGLMNLPGSADKDRIGALSKPSQETDEMEAVRASNPHREAAMIANIAAADTPLLVQLGNSHVDRVAAGLGNAVKVKQNEDFELYTKTAAAKSAKAPSVAAKDDRKDDVDKKTPEKTNQQSSF